MITRTALAQKIKDATLAFAKTRPGVAPNAAPYLKDHLVELVYPMLAKAWADGHQEAQDGIGPEHNPYAAP